MVRDVYNIESADAVGPGAKSEKTLVLSPEKDADFIELTAEIDGASKTKSGKNRSSILYAGSLLTILAISVLLTLFSFQLPNPFSGDAPVLEAVNTIELEDSAQPPKPTEGPAAVSSSQRKAFIVGIDAYDHLAELYKAKGDAEGYSDFFKDKLDYQITHLADPTQHEFLTAFEAFASSIARGDQVVFTFSGHGWSDGGENFLLPKDAPNGKAKSVLMAESVALNKNVLDRLEAQQPDFLLAIIDTCRENLLSDGTRTIRIGHATLEPKHGTMVVFSAGRTERALDWLKSKYELPSHSVFTRVLLPKLYETDRPLVDIVDETRNEVQDLASTVDHDQRPAVYSDVSRSFCLSGTCVTPAMREENAMWNRVRRDGSADAYRSYLFAYPDGRFAAEAKAALKILLGVDVPEGSVEEPALHPVVFRDCNECPEMVVIPSGDFVMGSSPDEEGHNDYEGPQRTVRIDYQFAVGKYEVTWAEWEACVADGGCSNSRPDRVGGDEDWGKGTRPVINVSWEDAQAYVQWLSRETGERYRLLSEAEWEYAARAGTTTPFSFGSTITPDQANYDGNHTYAGGPTGTSHRQTMPVGSYPRNAFGLHDMHGNVSEWVLDSYRSDYKSASNDGSVAPRSSGSDSLLRSERVIRGGNFSNEPGWLRSAKRTKAYANSAADNVGFRVARSLAD